MNSDLNMKLLLFTEGTHYLFLILLFFWFGLFFFLVKLFLNIFMYEILLYKCKYLLGNKFYYTVCRSEKRKINQCALLNVRTFSVPMYLSCNSYYKQDTVILLTA